MTWGYRNRPAPTVTGGGGKASGIELFDQQSRKKMLAAIEGGTMNGNDRIVNPKTPLDPIRVTVEEAGILQTYPPTWSAERPATTVVGTRRSEGGLLIGRQLDDGSRRDVGGKQSEVGLAESHLAGIRVSRDEAATLQAFPEGFKWVGAKTKTYLQIGNACPPLLTQHIFEALWATPTAPVDEFGLAA